jgi:hypothetical protein
MPTDIKKTQNTKFYDNPFGEANGCLYVTCPLQTEHPYENRGERHDQLDTDNA